jgi:DNA invertase Pin-like site-specific DNA recombinase
MRTEQPIDTGTAAGKCFLDMLGVFAEFETNRRKERQKGASLKPRLPAFTGSLRRPSISRL